MPFQQEITEETIREAIYLRSIKTSWRDIGRDLGWSHEGIRRAVKRASKQKDAK